MTIEFNTPELTELKPKITVLGVGGAGGNAVNNMIQAELQGVDFVVANTDAQALANSLADTRIQLGRKITQGLGAGSQPKIGREAAEEAIEDIQAELDGCHMVFVTAGMGGGTGTGAAPVIAESARDKGILTVGVVTKPFHFEGGRRMTAAEEGIEELQRHVDTLIIIPNQNLFRIATEKTTFQDAFAMADDVLHSGVRGITDLMVMPGLINLDFADVRTVMCEMGKAMMGTGESEGENRAVESAEAAISNPLLDEVSMKGARGVIINITGGMDLTLFEVDEAANYIRNQVDPDANIIVGSAFNESLNGQMRVSVVATGLEAEVTEQVGPPRPSRQSAEVVNFTAARESGGEETDDDEVAAEAAEAVGEQAGTREDAGTASAADVEAGAVVAEDAGDADQTVAQAETGSGTEPESAPEQAPESNPDQPAALRPGDENIFIVPEARKPKQAAVTGQADPFAEAALENAGREAEAAAGAKPSRSRAGRKGADAQSGRGMSLFERMTMGVRGSRSTMDKPANAPAEETADKSETDSEASRLGRVNPDDRPAPKADSQEQLEIPAFLRRQAN